MCFRQLQTHTRRQPGPSQSIAEVASCYLCAPLPPPQWQLSEPTTNLASCLVSSPSFKTKTVLAVTHGPVSALPIAPGAVKSVSPSPSFDTNIFTVLTPAAVAFQEIFAILGGSQSRNVFGATSKVTPGSASKTLLVSLDC